MSAEMKQLLILLMFISALPSSQRLEASEMLVINDGAQTSTFSCIETLTPDLLVISGGVAAQSVNPAEAGAQVEQRMLRIKNYLATQRGSPVLLDRLRGARNPGSERGENAALPLPFVQIQRFEAILPARSNIDLVLENLFKLGMDQYGKNIRIDDYSSRNFSMLTRYRFSDLRAKLQALVARCRSQKVLAMCTTLKSCVAKISYGTVSAKYLTEDGRRDFSVSFNSDQLLFPRSTEPPEPSSEAAIEFEFSGSLSVQRGAKQ
jgi:hypothetical protein